MSLDEVIKEILDQGKREAEAIEKEAEAEAERIIDEARAEGRGIIEKKKKEALDAIKKLENKELSALEIKAKKDVLSTSKQALDRLYGAALVKLDSLPQERRERILNALVAKASRELPGGYIYSNKKDEGFVKGNARFDFAGNIECSGGIIVESTDRTVKIDYTFEALLQDVWESSLAEVSKILLGESISG